MELKKQRHIGCDLDGTLAYFDEWKGCSHIGPPILETLNAVKYLLRNGDKVTIFTSRVAGEWGEDAVADCKKHIEAWCLQYIGQKLDVTATKLGSFTEIWDDKALGFEANTGTPTSSREVWEEATGGIFDMRLQTQESVEMAYRGLTR